jgi:RNA-binding protein
MCQINKLGVVLHVSGSRKLILRTKIRVKTGTKVLDEELRPVGRVFDVFGPVKNPYVSVESTTDKSEYYVGCFLYVV